MSEDELPAFSAVLRNSGRGTKNGAANPADGLRRSPRKQAQVATQQSRIDILEDAPQLCATSQQRISPQKQRSPTRTALKPTQSKARKPALDSIPKLVPVYAALPARLVKPIDLTLDDSEDDLARTLEPVSFKDRVVQDKNTKSRISAPKPTSTMSRITREAREQTVKPLNHTKPAKTAPKRSNPYVLKEAHCEDLNESSGTEGEDEETDLSGFVVADDAEISFHGSAEEEEASSSSSSSSSEDEKLKRRRKAPVERQKASTGRRLVRGSRRRVSDSEDDDLELLKALGGMKLGEQTLEGEKNARRKKVVEIIDLTSSPVMEKNQESLDHGTASNDDDDEAEDSFQKTKLNLFDNFDSALRLQPPSKKLTELLPFKPEALSTNSAKSEKPRSGSTRRAVTPPATPPRSPSKTKLKSPTKLLSPSKKTTEALRSPQRQSMDGFWDHNVINEWNDVNSPKKAPLLSPRKNPLARFNLLMNDDAVDSSSDLENSLPSDSSNSQNPFDESSDSLPSPTESPSKSRSPSKASALKAEQTRLREEKRARTAAKKAFDAQKEGMALNLLLALDRHVTGSKIGSMSASTGGIQVVWSKTLRSTAGRANWKRTVSKPSGSPVKGNPDSQTIESQPGVVVKHFASIELAEKIIDRPERLVNTLAHEFCHLANFMVSGIRDQPHGESFKQWGRKVTTWLSSSSAKKANGWLQEWALAEVTTKHSYVVETKYLWVCTGRPAEKQKQTLTMKMLNVATEDEEGCGAEYGRHSKSIDVDKQRCGRCKGFLVQVRPAPRGLASPKKSPMKRNVMIQDDLSKDKSGSGASIESLNRLMEDVDLSDSSLMISRRK